MSEKYKKTCKYLNHVEHFLILPSTVAGCFSIYEFASLYPACDVLATSHLALM